MLSARPSVLAHLGPGALEAAAAREVGSSLSRKRNPLAGAGVLWRLLAPPLGSGGTPSGRGRAPELAAPLLSAPGVGERALAPPWGRGGTPIRQSALSAAGAGRLVARNPDGPGWPHAQELAAAGHASIFARAVGTVSLPQSEVGTDPALDAAGAG